MTPVTFVVDGAGGCFKTAFDGALRYKNGHVARQESNVLMLPSLSPTLFHILLLGLVWLQSRLCV
jgi:hypothetical protein